ncbi:MAG: dihydrolipoamide acetyltransferase family protein [Bacillota bacterium]|nr:dihydrolipoamide acetyltransferase family protein [Bacillota bacterium]
MAEPGGAGGPAGSASYRAIPLRGMRRTIAQRMQRSLAETAQLTLHASADATELVRLRQARRAEGLAYDDLLVRALALSLREHPALNGWLVEDELRLAERVDVGLAVALPEGLIVPVIRDAASRSLREIAAERARLVERARSGRLAVSEVTGGTFTLTNLGMYRIEGFTPILNAPQIATLGVGRIAPEARVLEDGRIAARPVLRLSLTFDHRAVDGAPAAAFLDALVRRLEAADGLE